MRTVKEIKEKISQYCREKNEFTAGVLAQELKQTCEEWFLENDYIYHKALGWQKPEQLNEWEIDPNGEGINVYEKTIFNKKANPQRILAMPEPFIEHLESERRLKEGDRREWAKKHEKERLDEMVGI